MMDTTESIVIQKALFDQAEILAQRMNISASQLVSTAIERFIEDHHAVENDKHTTAQMDDSVIDQGDLYWLALDSDIPHPHVVVQDNVFNYSRIHTVVVCALTSNIQRGSYPGNVILNAGEANLPKPSVVEVSKIATADKAQLGAYIGSLGEHRIQQILAGLRFLQTSFYSR